MPTKGSRRGVTLIWVVLFLVVLIGFVGLAMDTAWMVLVHHQLQNAADSSALAGARWVRVNQDQARQAARDFAFANYAGTNAAGERVFVDMDLNTGNAPEGDIVLGAYSRLTGVFQPLTPGSSTIPNAVKSVARRTAALNAEQPLLFGSALTETANSAGAERSAIAYVAGGLGAGLLVLDLDDQCALTLSGSSTSQVYNGTIQVNSNHPCAVCVEGNAVVLGEEMNITGSGPCINGNPTVQVDNLNTGMPIIPDPLAWLPNPTQPPAATYQDSGNTRTYSPGFYANGIKTTGNIHYVFNPGIYYIGTQNGSQQVGLDLNGGASVTAIGVFFYVAAGPTQIGANTVFNIQAMENTGTSYDHITVFQSRTNLADASINGGSNSTLTGTLYFPKNHCLLNGDGGNFGTQVIANTLTVSGNGILDILYDGAFPGSLANRVLLVK